MIPNKMVMGNWIPNDPKFMSHSLRISSAFPLPPPESFISPMTRGVGTYALERHDQTGVPEGNISKVKDTHLTSPGQSSADFIDILRRFCGPTMNAFEAAEPGGKAEELHNQLRYLAKAQNGSANGGTSMSATFLRTTLNI